MEGFSGGPIDGGIIHGGGRWIIHACTLVNVASRSKSTIMAEKLFAVHKVQNITNNTYCIFKV